MTQSAAPVVVTGEELLVFAASRGLPIPAGLEDLDVARLDGDVRQARLVQAGRSLLSRGVMPAEPAPDTVESPLAAVLTVVCDPSAVLTLAVTDEAGSLRVSFNIADGRVVVRTWDALGMQSVGEMNPLDLEPVVLHAAGLEDLPGTGTTGPRIVVPGTALAGPPETAQLTETFAAALEQVGADSSLAASLAAALQAGNGATLLARVGTSERGTAFLVSWAKLDSGAVWSFGPAPSGEGPDSLTVEFEQVSVGVLRDIVCDQVAAVARQLNPAAG